MDGPCQELLSRSALALDQHGHVGPRDAAHHDEDLLHGGRAAQHALAAGRRLPHTLLLDVGLDRLEIRRPLERDFQVVEPDRLVVIVERAELDRADRAPAAAVTGEDDHLGLGRGLHDLIQRLEPRLGALRIGGQPEVEADERRPLALERREGLHAVLGKEEREVVPQPILELRTDQLLVLDDEEGGLVHAPPPIGSLTETVVPAPSVTLRATMRAAGAMVVPSSSRDTRSSLIAAPPRRHARRPFSVARARSRAPPRPQGGRHWSRRGPRGRASAPRTARAWSAPDRSTVAAPAPECGRAQRGPVGSAG